MEQKLDHPISQIFLFQGLIPHQLSSLAGITVSKTYLKGESIFHEGDEAMGFFAVTYGRVKIFKSNLSGREQILHLFGPGEVFGEVPVFTGGHFPASAMAMEESTCLFLPKRGFLDLIRREPEIALGMLGLLANRLRTFTIQVENLSLKEVPERLAAYLIFLAEKHKSQTFALDLPKGELAQLLGTIPETLSRIFNRMTQQNLILVTGAEITIRDLGGVGSLARGTLRL